MNNLRDLALNKEINKEYINAVELYEDCIDNGNATLDVYSNLAFIYWEFATEQISFNVPNNISDDWSLIGGKKYGQILDLGMKRYPDSLELKFLKKYFAYRLFFEEFSQIECEQLIEEYKEDESLIPYFYLYLFDNEKYNAERDKLLELCDEIPNAKFNYIKSIIQKGHPAV